MGKLLLFLHGWVFDFGGDKSQSIRKGALPIQSPKAWTGFALLSLYLLYTGQFRAEKEEVLHKTILLLEAQWIWCLGSLLYQCFKLGFPWVFTPEKQGSLCFLGFVTALLIELPLKESDGLFLPVLWGMTSLLILSLLLPIPCPSVTPIRETSRKAAKIKSRVEKAPGMPKNPSVAETFRYMGEWGSSFVRGWTARVQEHPVCRRWLDQFMLYTRYILILLQYSCVGMNVGLVLYGCLGSGIPGLSHKLGWQAPRVEQLVGTLPWIIWLLFQWSIHHHDKIRTIGVIQKT